MVGKGQQARQGAWAGGFSKSVPNLSGPGLEPRKPPKLEVGRLFLISPCPFPVKDNEDR